MPHVIRVADVAPVPWHNGGGQTRVLLAWPAAADWIVRISVAQIAGSGPFSELPGVDRWIAVIAGDPVTLAGAGGPPRTLDAGQRQLHAFAGEHATGCTLQGAASHDFNLMLRRGRGTLQALALQDAPRLACHGEIHGLFTVAPVTVTDGAGRAHAVPAMALAWWHNPRHERSYCGVSGAKLHGWWFQADRIGSAGAPRD